jgi:hypothetical protein
MQWPPASFTLDSGVWKVVGPAGNGSVGEVFKVSHVETGEIGAIKAIAVEAGDRDRLAADLSRAGVRNIVPIVETGTANGMTLYRMPLADWSLRDHLNGNPGPCPEPDVTEMLHRIATALVDMGNRVFHRDIKPENLLWHADGWCMSDFGTARDQAVATATATHNREAMNAYTAPERWRLESATGASDVYSLGVVAYEMLAGATPFAGPEVGEFLVQHTSEPVPPLASSVSVRLATLVERMLSKVPGQRPAPQHILDILDQIRDEVPVPSAGAEALRRANLKAVRTREEHAAIQASRQRTDAERKALSEAALDELIRIGIHLKDAVYAIASEAGNLAGSYTDWSIGLMGAVMRFELTEGSISSERAQGLPFDVIATAEISLRLPPDPQREFMRGPGEFSHSLWYCDPQPDAEGKYGWYETAFATYVSAPAFGGALVPALSVPRAETVTDQTIGAFQRPSIGTVCVWPFELTAPGELGTFVDRWLQWLAAATEGELPSADHTEVDRGWWTRP